MMSLYLVLVLTAANNIIIIITVLVMTIMPIAPIAPIAAIVFVPISSSYHEASYGARGRGYVPLPHTAISLKPGSSGGVWLALLLAAVAILPGRQGGIGAHPWCHHGLVYLGNNTTVHGPRRHDLPGPAGGARCVNWHALAMGLMQYSSYEGSVLVLYGPRTLGGGERKNDGRKKQDSLLRSVSQNPIYLGAARPPARQVEQVRKPALF